MRFSTVATISAVFAGAIASPLANPDVVYETRIVTITSCGPSVTSCPAKTTVVPATSTPAVVVPTVSPTAPVYLNTTARATTPCPTGTGVTGLPPKPTGGSSSQPAPVCPGPNCPTYPIVPSGAPVPPKNTSVPVVPVPVQPSPVQPSAPVHTGAAGKVGASILAVAGAAAFALLA